MIDATTEKTSRNTTLYLGHGRNLNLTAIQDLINVTMFLLRMDLGTMFSLSVSET